MTPHGGFHHVALSVKSIETSKAFYSRLLGLKAEQAFRREDLGGTGLFLAKEGLRLELWEMDRQAPRQDDPSNLNVLGLKHVTVTVDDLDAFIDETRKKGIRVPEPSTGASGKRYAFIADPDGNQIELYEG